MSVFWNVCEERWKKKLRRKIKNNLDAVRLERGSSFNNLTESIEKSYSHSCCFVCKNETFFCANRNSLDETHAKNSRHKAKEYPIQQKSLLHGKENNRIRQRILAMLKRLHTFEISFPKKFKSSPFFSLHSRFWLMDIRLHIEKELTDTQPRIYNVLLVKAMVKQGLQLLLCEVKWSAFMLECNLLKRLEKF